MKITKISSSGTVAIRKVDLDLVSPITLVCGSNRAGKSSLRDAIFHAFTGKTSHDVLKKDYGLLVNRADENAVGYTYIEYDNGQKACITLPNGTHELTQPMHMALPYVLNPSLFARNTTDERRRLLFDLGNLRSDGAEVKAKLIKRKCDPVKVEAILPFLKSSFDNAQKNAAEKVKAARADWKATTGEVYGDKKAIDWKAQKPEINQELATSAKNTLVELDKEIEENNIKLGEYVAIINGGKSRDSEIARLTESAEKIDRIKLKLEADKKEHVSWSEKLETAKKLALGVAGKMTELVCPSCGSFVYFDGTQLVQDKPDDTENKEAATKVPLYQQHVDLFQKSVTSGERDLVSAENAKETLDRMKKDDSTKAVVTPETLASLKVCIESLKNDRKEGQEKLDLLNKNIQLAAEADGKTKKAAGYYADAQAWDLIASSLSPEGIPSEMLSAALDPINKRITKSVRSLGFPGDVKIHNDMTIMEDAKKLYSFSSKATKLLIDSMIAEAISYVSGIRMYMVDEFDLLDVPSRENYLNWLLDLTDDNEIDSVLLFGTLKTLPKVPPQIRAYWIESGFIQDAKAEAAA